MTELKNGQVQFIGTILSITVIKRGSKDYELTVIRLDTGSGKQPLREIEAKKNDPLITADEYDKVRVVAWVNGNEWKEKVYQSLSLAHMELLEKSDAVDTQLVDAEVGQAEEQASESLPF